MEVSNECTVPTQIPNEPGVYVADASCTDENGWTHYWKNARTAPATASDLLLLSVKDLEAANGILHPEEVTVTVTNKYGSGGHDLSLSAPYVANDKGWFVMGRYYQTAPTRQPNDSILLRFYFDDMDLSDLQTSIGSQSLSREDLVVFSVDQGFEGNPAEGHDSVTADVFQEYWHSASPGIHTWAEDDFTGWYGATVKLVQLSSGGAGTGGEGTKFGAEYPQPMLEFTGFKEEESIKLNWTTAREILTRDFEIYKSLDNVSFEKIVSQDASIFRLLPQSYDTVDPNPVEGSNFYYVKVMHENGESYNSDTIEIRYQTQFTASVYPNPFAEYLDVTLDAEESGPTHFGIYNGAWQKLVEDEWNHQLGLVHRVDINNLPPGIYFYVVSFDEATYRGKLVRQPN